MDARSRKVSEVLDANERFVVPLYQRKYQWHDRRDGGRTSAFWLDVVAKAAEVLEQQSRFDHYMGALLLAPDDDAQRPFGVTPVNQVVDGQQRLTTFLIMLSAMREVASEHEHSALVEKINKRYLFNECDPAEPDPDLARFKLTPTREDREVLLDILEKPYLDVRTKYTRLYRGDKVPQNTPFRALRAYEYFKAQIEEFLVTGASDDTEVDIDQEGGSEENTRDVNSESHRRLNALLEALVYRLKLIVITLGRDDDAQVIFESLNSKGQQLLAMDLVRNNIFHRAEAQYRGDPDARNRAEELYLENWVFEDSWWNENAPNARPTRPRIDHFLANLLTAEIGKRITVRELYAEYRAWATPEQRPRFEKVEDELAVLQRHVPAYETLEDRHTGLLDELLEIAPAEPPQGYEAIAWFGRRLKVWQITTVYPIAFQVASADIDSDTQWRIVKLLDSCLARRLLCDLTPKNLNQVFPRLAAALIRDGVSVKTVGDFFRRYGEAAISRFPDDNELRAGILEKQAYGRISSPMLSSLLWSLELASRTGKTEDTKRPADIQIEHIMPQKWQTHWLLNGKKVEVGDTEAPGYWQRATAIHTLGNLTIVASRLNPALSNAAFDVKAPELFEHSNLTLNRRIAEYETWDENTIRSRGEALADLAIKIWPNLENC